VTDDGSVSVAFEPLYRAVSLCLEHKLQLPALVLLYTAIDIAGWCAAEVSDRSVKTRFTSFVDRYVLPKSGLLCSALELYGARCGVLHTYTPESDLSAQGQARIIAYAWGNANAADLQESIRRMQRADMVAVHIDTLFSALQSGVARLDEEVASDPARGAAVRGRRAKQFGSLSTEIMQLFLDNTQRDGGA
jgi:hypothetical protein